METFTLVVHIIGFSLSLILFPVLAIGAITRHRLPRIITSLSISLTSLGFITGVGLLIVHPTGSRCAMLVAYLAAFIALYYVAENAPSRKLAKENARD